MRDEGLRGGGVFMFERDELTGGRCSWDGGGRCEEWKSCWRTFEYGGPARAGPCAAGMAGGGEASG